MPPGWGSLPLVDGPTHAGQIDHHPIGRFVDVELVGDRLIHADRDARVRS